MLDREDINFRPDLKGISAYIQNPLFDQLCRYMDEEYKALCRIDYSKDVWAKGWNVKFRKSGKALCVIYPKKSYFTVLVVVGKKEKERVQCLLPYLPQQLQDIYHQTREGNGQRWLMIDLSEDDARYRAVLELIRIRRECR